MFETILAMLIPLMLVAFVIAMLWDDFFSKRARQARKYNKTIWKKIDAVRELRGMYLNNPCKDACFEVIISKLCDCLDSDSIDAATSMMRMDGIYLYSVAITENIEPEDMANMYNKTVKEVEDLWKTRGLT